MRYSWIFAFLLSTNLLAAALPKVCISQVIDHPALNKTKEGIIDALAEAGYPSGDSVELSTESAQGSVVIASQIAAKIASQRPAVAVAIGTVAAQSMIKYATNGEFKLVFSSITDPQGANLLQRNCSGVSNFIDLEPQIELFKQLQPNLKRLGILYNPGESNSVAILEKLEQVCRKAGIELITQGANKTAEVAQQAMRLAANVDALFVSNDNTVLGSIQSVVRAARSAKIPLYVSDVDAVESGALAALGPNQYLIGKKTGEMVVALLQGKEIAELPVIFPTERDLYLNVKVAQELALVIPQELLEKAILVETP